MTSELFCKVCENLLVPSKTSGSSFKFRCMRCNETRNSTPEDSLRYREQKADHLSKYSNLLKTIADDPMNPKEKKKCRKCPNNIVKQIRLENSILINQCTKCNERWVGV